jgi:acyl-ACP thioesterase
VARYLQDVASDDVDETGWGAPDHLWVVRSIRIDVQAPPLADDRVELTTWSSGRAAVAASRRLSLEGDAGGRIELDSTWIHLGPDQRPARIEDFGPYRQAAGERVASTRLELTEPAPDAARVPWRLRTADADLLGHVNNAAYWQPVEHCLAESGIDPRRPHRARLDYRHPVDLGDDLVLLVDAAASRLSVAFSVDGTTKAVALVEPLA